MRTKAHEARGRMRSIVAAVAAAMLVIVMLPALDARAVVEPALSGAARRAAVEGIVMLKNDNGVLPLNPTRTVSVFGRVQINYFAVGYGSGGEVKAPYRTNLLTGLRQNPAIKVNESLARVYEAWTAANVPSDGTWGSWPTSYPEMPLSDTVVQTAAEESDTAVVVLGRSAGEDRESTDTPGSYRLTTAEQDMLAKVNAAFSKVVVLINAGNLIDMSWLDTYQNIDSVLYVWQGGMESGTAIADVLSGDESPSGKLPQTIAKSLADYPSHANFGNAAFNNYAEDIFVGYRYFETFAPDRVMYPFGFGLSYTSFHITTRSVTEAGGKIKVAATVTNTGAARGKEVVQVYYGAPQGQLGKATKSLVAYAKTNELQPGSSEDIDLTFKVSDMASYDDGNYTGHDEAWVLEAGNYPVYVGSSVRAAAQVYTHTEGTTRVTEQLQEVAAPKVPFARWHASQGTDGVQLDRTSQTTPRASIDLKARISADIPETSPDLPYNEGDKGIKLIDVYDGSKTLEELMSQFTLQDLADLARGAGPMGDPSGIPGNAGVYAGGNARLRGTFGIPPISTTDGPSGIRMTATASLLPIGTLLASTWNLPLVEDLYAGLGKEMLLNGSDVLLAPGMNIQRDPLNGRNFEYFSEDPMLTGTMGAATVRGVQSQGVAATPKHYVANNQETNRKNTDSRISERALREIYLKGFEITVKSGRPDNLMTAYNMVNGSFAYGNYDLLTTVLRKEWGFTGVVMTDWGLTQATCADMSLTSTSLMGNSCRVRGGGDLIMPGGADRGGSLNPPEAAVTAGNLHIGELQRVAKNVLTFALKSRKFRQDNGLPLVVGNPGAQWFEVDQPEAGERPQLDGIKIDGVPLEGFSPQTNQYTVYAKDLDAVPTVTVDAASDLQVTITQATPATRLATVSIVGPDGAASQYRVFWSDDPDMPLPPGAVRAVVTTLKINGQPFLPFYQGIYHYEIPGVPPSAVTFSDIVTPEGVTATVLGPDVSGTYTVRAESAQHRRDYLFTFTDVQKVKPISDDFAGTTLKSAWTVDNPSANYSKPDGSVQIVTEPGDWYQTGSNLHNTVWQRADGDWTAVTKVDFDQRPFQSYHQFGVVVFQDENNFLEFQLEYSGGASFAVKNETNGTNVATRVSATTVIPGAGAGIVYLKVVKVGSTFQFAYSADGTSYTQLGPVVTKAMGQPKFGLQAAHSANGVTTDVGNGPTKGQALIPVTVNYDSVDFTVDDPDVPIPTAPVVAIPQTGTTEARLASSWFYHTSALKSQPCSGACSGENVGYTATGEYALYNLDVEKAGFYEVAPQFSSGAAETAPDQTSFSLNVNGDLAATFAQLGGTGGWQNWVTLPAQVVYLKEGINKLQLFCDTGGFNLSYLRFTPSSVDRTQLSSLIDQAGALSAASYTARSWSTLTAALGTARTVYASAGSTTEDVDAAAAALASAIDGLRLLGNADTEQLSSTASVVAGLVDEGVVSASDFTRGAWATFLTARAAIDELLADDDALQAVSQTDVDALLDGLTGALSGLSEQRRGDVAPLRTVVDSLDGLLSGSGYTAGWAAYESAAATAQAVLASDARDVSRTAVDDALSNLSAAIAGLVPGADGAAAVSALRGSIAVAEAAKDVDQYTSTSRAGLGAPLSQAKRLVARAESGVRFSAGDVAAVAQPLQVAIDALEERVLTSAISELVDQIDALDLQQSSYTATSWQVLAAARAAAQEAAASATTQAQVDVAFGDLVSAFTGLEAVVIVDRQWLSSAIAAAESKAGQATAYTAVTWSVFDTALTGARAVRDDAGATQAEVDGAATALVNALAGLVVAPSTGGPTPPPGDGGTKPVTKPAAVTVTSVRAGQARATIVRKKSISVPVRVYYSNGTSGARTQVTWASSNPKIAKVNRRTGKVTAVRKGSATITATAKARNSAGKTVKATVKVKVLKKKPARSKATVKKVSASVPKTIVVGTTAAAKGTYTPSKAPGVTLTYRSSKASVLTVDVAGTITAKKVGTAKLVVKAGKKSRTYTLRVVRA